jgi:hypothetical protein
MPYFIYFINFQKTWNYNTIDTLTKNKLVKYIFYFHIHNITFQFEIFHCNKQTRRLSENGFVGRLSEHFGDKAERTKTPEA